MRKLVAILLLAASAMADGPAGGSGPWKRTSGVIAPKVATDSLTAIGVCTYLPANKFTIAYNNATLAAATTTASITLLTLASASQDVCGVTAIVGTPFAATSLTSIKLYVGSDTSGNEGWYGGPIDLVSASSNTNKIMLLGQKHDSTSDVVRLTFTAAGANMSTLSAGSLTVWIGTITRP